MTSKIEPAYDNTAEQNLNRLICSLDENPILCVDPVISSTYLGFSLATSEEGFQMIIESVYDAFINYFDDFAEACIDKGFVGSILQPTIARLLVKYEQSIQKFKNSSLREEWKYYSEYFEISKVEGDWQKEKEQKYTRYAYKFFYKASCIQMFYLRKVIDNLKILRVSENSNITITESNSPDTSDNKKSNKEIKYNFEIRPGEPKELEHKILEALHKELMNENYIDCSFPKFEKVFSKDPMPIIWLNYYNHLGYLIKIMSIKFLEIPRSPSNMMIAKKLFYYKKDGVYFATKRDRLDTYPKRNYRKKLFTIVNSSINYLLDELENFDEFEELEKLKKLKKSDEL